jgi:secondary thiamine-phosphate synthase enzyme
MLADLEAFFARLAPLDAAYGHTRDGPDDMPAHIRAALTNAHLSIPVVDGDLMLSPAQAVLFFEHRTAPQRRRVALHLMT